MAGGEVAQRAKRFKRVRDAHQTEMAEDYVELIADLIDEKGEARVVDLAGCLGVTKPTVASAIQRLQREGWSAASATAPSSDGEGRGADPARADATATCASLHCLSASTPGLPTPTRRGSSTTSAVVDLEEFAATWRRPAPRQRCRTPDAGKGDSNGVHRSPTALPGMIELRQTIH
jgi:hypothetical protein